MNIFYYDIAVGLPIRQCFTYKSKNDIKKGTRVIVPFGNKTLIGIVVKKIATSESLKGLKEIVSIPDDYTCFDKSIFEHIEFFQKNLEDQNVYSSKFSQILQEMDIFQSDENEEKKDENQEDNQENRSNENDESEDEDKKDRIQLQVVLMLNIFSI